MFHDFIMIYHSNRCLFRVMYDNESNKDGGSVE
jgi:hypothetical protein